MSLDGFHSNKIYNLPEIVYSHKLSFALCYNKFSRNSKIMDGVRRFWEGLLRKNCWSLGFCPNEGEGGQGPAQIFRPLFISAFLVNEWSPFYSKMPVI